MRNGCKRRPVRLAPAFAAAGLTFAASGEAQAESPSPSWRAAERVAVRCRLDARPTDEALRRTLCASLVRAAEGGPIPVVEAEPGDPVLTDPRTVALLAHFAVQTHRGERLLVVTLRTQQSGEAPAFFGGTPRVLAYPTDPDADFVRQALRAALAETLPWRRAARPGSRQPIR